MPSQRASSSRVPRRLRKVRADGSFIQLADHIIRNAVTSLVSCIIDTASRFQVYSRCTDVVLSVMECSTRCNEEPPLSLHLISSKRSRDIIAMQSLGITWTLRWSRHSTSDSPKPQTKIELSCLVHARELS
jgi:hypothetical protein